MKQHRCEHHVVDVTMTLPERTAALLLICPESDDLSSFTDVPL
jgi:hypothetical protein